MEIPVINKTGDFEAGITSLQNPSVLSQIFALSGVENIHQAYSFWKWGALILALLASFSTIINRIKILILRIQHHYLISSSPPTSSEQDYDCDTETDTSCSSVSDYDDDYEDEEEEEEKEEHTTSSSLQNWGSIDEDFSVRGSGHVIDHRWQNSKLRRRGNSSLEDLFSSFSEFTNGKDVVRLWDNLGLGLKSNIENQSKKSVSFYDMHKEQSLFSIFGEKPQIPAVSTASSSPAVIVSAETNVSDHLLRVWDTRLGGRLPGILAEWRPKLGKIVGIGGGGRAKIYVKDDIKGRLTVGDMRKLRSPLVAATESDVETWSDADAVIVGEDESVDEVSGGDSVLRHS